MVKHAANMCSCLGDTHSLSLFCHPAYTHTSPCHCEWNQVIQVQSDEEREDDEEIMMDDDEAATTPEMLATLVNYLDWRTEMMSERKSH